MSESPATDTDSAPALTPLELIEQRIALHRKAGHAAQQQADAFRRQAIAIQGALRELLLLKRQLAGDGPPT